MPLGSLGFDPNSRRAAKAVSTPVQDTDHWIQVLLHANSQAMFLMDFGINYIQWNSMSPAAKMTLAQTAPLPRFEHLNQSFGRLGRAPTLQEMVGAWAQPRLRYDVATPIRSDAIAREIVATLDSYCAGLVSLPPPGRGPQTVITSGNIANFARHYPDLLLQLMMNAANGGHGFISSGYCEWWNALPPTGPGNSKLMLLRGQLSDANVYSWGVMSAMALLDGLCWHQTQFSVATPYRPNLDGATRSAGLRPAGLASTYTTASSYTNGPTLLAAGIAFAAGYATSRILRAKRR